MELKIIDGKYKVLKKLGKGSTSTVYLVKNENGNQIALKLLEKNTNDRRINRLKYEFKLMHSLNHKNIAKVYDFGFDLLTERYYFTLEFIPHGNFLDFNIKKNSQEVLLSTFYQLLNGLDYLHNNNFIHCDVTPNNVLVKIEQNGEIIIKITDFGLTTQFDSITNRLQGTLNYMAPEVIKGYKNVNCRSDLFSAGLILLNCLLKENEYTTSNSVTHYLQKRKQFDTKIIKDKLEQLNDFKYIKFISSLLETDPEMRIESANKAISNLNEIFHENFKITDSNSTKQPFTNITIFRTKEYKKILSIFEATKYFKKNSIFLSGEKGSGKGRLLKEFEIHNQFINNLYLKIDPQKDKNHPESYFAEISKLILSLNPDLAENIKLVLQKIASNNTEKKITKKKIEEYLKLIHNILHSYDPNKRLVIEIDNLEQAGKTTLDFIKLLLNKFSGSPIFFLIFSINKRNITHNKELLFEIMRNYIDKTIEIQLENLTLKQIKEIVSSYFTNLKDAPLDFYDKIQNLSGNNISRVNKLLSLLYQKNIIKKTLSGYVFSSYANFKKVIKTFIEEEINFSKVLLSKEHNNILQAISLSLIPLSVEEISFITKLPQSGIKEYINKVYNLYYIKTAQYNPEKFSITEPALRKKVIDLLEIEKRTTYHKNISICLQRQHHKEILNRLYKFIHSFLSCKNITDKQTYKFNLVANSLLKNKEYNNFILFYTAAIEKSSFIKKSILAGMYYQIIVLIFQKKLQNEIEEYIDKYYLVINDLKSESNLFLQKNKIIKAIEAVYRNHQNLKKYVDELQISERKSDDSYPSVVIDLMLSTMQLYYSHNKTLIYADELFKATENKDDLIPENNYIKIYQIISLNNVSKKYNSKELLQQIEQYYQKIIESENSICICRTMLSKCNLVEQNELSQEIDDLYEQSFSYCQSHNHNYFLYLAKNSYAKHLGYNYKFKLAAKEINETLSLKKNDNYLTPLGLLLKNRCLFRLKLESPLQEILHDYHILNKIYNCHTTKQLKSDIFEQIISLYHEAGDLNQENKYLTKYLTCLNYNGTIDKRSTDFFIYSHIRNYSSAQIVMMAIPHLQNIDNIRDEILERIIDIKSDLKINGSKKEIEKSNILNNEIIIEIINEYIEKGLVIQKSKIESLINRYDKSTRIYRRANLVLSLFNHAGNNKISNELKQDITILKGKGYLNTAAKLASAIARFYYYKQKDDKNFLQFAKLTLKINGEIFFKTPKHLKNIIRNDEDIILLNDIWHDIKKKHKQDNI